MSIDTEKRTSRFRKTFKKDENCLKGNAIMNLKLLNDAISTAAMCNSSKNPQSQLTFRELIWSRKGLVQWFNLVCSSCSAAIYFYSSSIAGRMLLVLTSSQCMQAVKEMGWPVQQKLLGIESTLWKNWVLSQWQQERKCWMKQLVT